MVGSRSATATARSRTWPPARAFRASTSSRCTSDCSVPRWRAPHGWLKRRTTAHTLRRRAEGKLADFEIKDLRASVEGRQILKGVSLAISKGEVHAVMGPNGSGKSTLSHTLMGHPGYTVDGGSVIFKGQNVLELEPDERARLGMFLAFQYPVEVLHMDDSFLPRYINDGFSGGEKKRAEILQMAMLKPEIAILDETDSGLDIDSIKFVAAAVNRMRGPELGALIITHYTRILEFIKPDFVHVLVDGRFVLSGGPEVADRLEKTGYSEWMEADEPAVLAKEEVS